MVSFAAAQLQTRDVWGRRGQDGQRKMVAKTNGSHVAGPKNYLEECEDGAWALFYDGLWV